MARYTFRRARITLEAPSTWRKGPFLKRMLYPHQPELFGPNNEYIGVDSVDSVDRVDRPLTVAEATVLLRDYIVGRGNRVVSVSSLEVGGKEHATAIFDKPMPYQPREVIRMKKYRLALAGFVYTITATLSFEGSIADAGEGSPYTRGYVLTSWSRRTTFYSEDGYDRIVKSITVSL
jgi:hypothetical protein